MASSPTTHGHNTEEGGGGKGVRIFFDFGENISKHPNVGHGRWKLSRNMYMSHAQFLHVWAPILRAQSVLIDKTSASELSRKLIKSAASVGWVCDVMCSPRADRT